MCPTPKSHDIIYSNRNPECLLYLVWALIELLEMSNLAQSGKSLVRGREGRRIEGNVLELFDHWMAR